MSIVVVAACLLSPVAGGFSGKYGSSLTSTAVQAYRVDERYAAIGVGSVSGGYEYADGDVTISSSTAAMTVPALAYAARVPGTELRLQARYDQDQTRRRTTYRRHGALFLPTADVTGTDETVSAGGSWPLVAGVAIGGEYVHESSREARGASGDSRLRFGAFVPSVAAFGEQWEVTAAYAPPVNVRDADGDRTRAYPTKVAVSGEWLATPAYAVGIGLERSDYSGIDHEGQVTLDPTLYGLLWDTSGGFIGAGYTQVAAAQAPRYAGVTHAGSFEVMKSVHGSWFLKASVVRGWTRGERPLGDGKTKVTGGATAFNAGVVWKS